MTTDADMRLEVRHRIAASPERLFAAWTTPEQLLAWWGTKGGVYGGRAVVGSRGSIPTG
ncbi:MAG TPA: hypothetical protein EYM41_10665 [Dehalococcoidia bacterium]|nr:hypothetical protein [Dehalococcoidia bacterium]